ncbi:MAG: hypothetical protein QXX79_07730 [Candidatus Bathyarchaeia archaeon]
MNRDVKQRKSCLGINIAVSFWLMPSTQASFYQCPNFYRKYGFISANEGSAMYSPIEGEYRPVPKAKYEPLEENVGEAVNFMVRSARRIHKA